MVPKLILFVCLVLLASQPIEGASGYLPTDPSFREDTVWLRQRVEGMMESNVGKQPDGRTVFYADALRHYNLIFTRGFGYIYENAGNLISRLTLIL